MLSATLSKLVGAAGANRLHIGYEYNTTNCSKTFSLSSCFVTKMGSKWTAN